VEYGYRKKGSARHYKYKIIDTFVLTNDIEKIKTDKNLRERMMREIKTENKEVEFTFKNIYVEGQYGNTNY
tara:strand:- start:366 stop:578 length:213 start_codon:yes stop_codon:yes gene_type:complete